MGRRGKTMGQSLPVSREKPKQCKAKPTGIAKVFGDVANRTSQDVHRSRLRGDSLGRYWAFIRLFRHLAACHQYGHHDCHILDGVI